MTVSLHDPRRARGTWRTRFAAWLVAFGSVAAGTSAQSETAAAPERLALRCAKLVTCAEDGAFFDDGVLLVEDGKIAALGEFGDVALPEGTPLVDLGERWLMPGMVDLHSHIAGSGDINGAVYQTNHGLKVRASVRPGAEPLQRGLAAGVTTILFIPGSATNLGGQGVLLKTAGERYEDMLVRDPGSLKLAQADNPKRWGYRMERAGMNFQIRDSLLRGVGYAKAWEAFERGEGPEPLREPQYDVYRDLIAGRAQISAHTQQAQVIASTVRIAAIQAKLPVFIDHGTMDGFKVAAYAEEHGVPAILGPRSISSQNKGRGYHHDGKILGVAAEYQQRGHSTIGFNTDAPVIPQEELQLQAAIGVRFGFDDRGQQAMRGLTLVPARTAGIAHRVGSLEVGKDADLVALGGHPADPRNGVDAVWIEGEKVYDAEEGRVW